MMNKIVLFFSLSFAGFAHAADINPQVANAYNDGIVRCGNADCAKYLYACFRAFSSNSLNEFLACGSQASRLNNDEFVVAPSDQTATADPAS